jgi:subtilisin family serine protease
VGQAGVPVSVSIASGGGSLTGATTVNTSSNGRATFTGLAIRGTIGPRTLTFTSPDLTAVSSGTVDVAAGVAALLAPHDGNQQTAAISSAVSIPPSVTVTDADNNSVAGVPVIFQVTTGGGTVNPTTPLNTDASGIATVTSWTLGAAPGPNSLTATAAALPGSAVVFTATGNPVTATIRGTITISSSLLSLSQAGARTARFRIPGPVKSEPRLRSRGNSRPAEYTPDELIVTLRSAAIGAPRLGSLALASRSAAAAVAGEIRSHMALHLSASVSVLTGISPAIMTARIRVKDPANISKVAAALRMDPAVATVERNALVRSESRVSLPTRSSNDPLYPFQAWHYAMIDLPEAWSITTGSAGVLVAVVDDGIRFDHPAIAANLTSDGYDFVSDPGQVPLCSGGSVDFSGDGDGPDPNPTIPVGYDFNEDLDCLEGPQALGNHGLHVAGTIGAPGNDGIGVSGVNWTVRIRPVRVLGVDGTGSSYDIAQGLLYAAGLAADNGAGGMVEPPLGAKIINISIGGRLTTVEQNAVIAASNAGALIIASAGNNANSDPSYPAAFPEVLSVSAVGPDGTLASYSSFGPTVDIAAPGGDFATGDPTFGIGSTSWDFTTGLPAYKFEVGTSMAAPHVAGVAALLLAQDPGLTRSELRSRLIDYAVDAGSPGRDDRYGAGIVNARNSLARNFGPPREQRARLYDALTGAAVQSVAVASDGSYSFAVTNGSYQVFAGQDENGDQLIGLPGRRWGAFGGASTPSRINVNGSGTYHASFPLGFPSEHEPNGTFDDNASLLVVNGYLSGAMPAGDDDVFLVLISQAGEYTFETSAVDGACGFALEEDTVLGLYHADQTAIDLKDDIDAAANNLCSKITATLEPGTYFLRVQGKFGGRYRIQARSGP